GIADLVAADTRRGYRRRGQHEYVRLEKGRLVVALHPLAVLERAHHHPDVRRATALVQALHLGAEHPRPVAGERIEVHAALDVEERHHDTDDELVVRHADLDD